MSDNILYPKTINELKIKLKYLSEKDQNKDTVKSIEDWLVWFDSLNYENELVCDGNEYLKIHSKDGNFSLQKWQHDNLVDSIKCNVIANYPSVYDSENTIIIE